MGTMDMGTHERRGKSYSHGGRTACIKKQTAEKTQWLASVIWSLEISTLQLILMSKHWLLPLEGLIPWFGKELQTRKQREPKIWTLAGAQKHEILSGKMLSSSDAVSFLALRTRWQLFLRFQFRQLEISQCLLSTRGEMNPSPKRMHSHKECYRAALLYWNVW